MSEIPFIPIPVPYQLIHHYFFYQKQDLYSMHIVVKNFLYLRVFK